METRDFLRNLLNEADDVQEYLKEHKEAFIAKLKELSTKVIVAEEEAKEEDQKLAKELEKKLEIKE